MCAFITPIIRSGWNLYDVHPPVKIVHRRPKKVAAKQPSSTGNLQSILLHRRHTVNGSAGSASSSKVTSAGRSIFTTKLNRRASSHVKAFHANAVANGQYYLQAFSTDSLRMRNLDLQVIPEEVEDEVQNEEENSSPDLSPAILTPTAGGNLKESKGRHFLNRIRRLFGLIPKSSDEATMAVTKKTSTLSNLAAQRRRS